MAKVSTTIGITFTYTCDYIHITYLILSVICFLFNLTSYVFVLTYLSVF